MEHENGGSGPREQTLADLKARFKGKILLTPSEIAQIIGTSEAVQANMRADGNFPFPFVKIGRRVAVNIYHVADYLSGGADSQEKQQDVSTPLVAPETPRPILSAAPRNKPKGGKKSKNAYLLAFSAGIQFQLEVFAELEKLHLSESISSAKEDAPACRNGL